MMNLKLAISTRLIVSFALIILICCVGYRGNLISKIVFAVMISVLWTLMEFIVGGILVYFQVSADVMQFCGILVSKLMTFILIKILQRFFKNQNIQGIPLKYEIILLTIIIGNMFTVYYVFSIASKVKCLEEPIITLGILLVVNVLTFKIYLKLAEDMEIRMQNMVYAQQLNLCTVYNQEKETMLLEYRNARHDFKQHIIILIKYLEENDPDSAKKYLAKLIEDNPFHEVGISKSDNIVVDAIVNAKYAKACKADIEFCAQINIPIQLPFENGDISIILGNILDNAVEACLKIDILHRKIDLVIKYEKNALLIVCRNSFSGELLRSRNGELQTSKSNPQNHGLGLRSIHKIADKYHGAVVYDTTENQFTLKVILYVGSKT